MDHIKVYNSTERGAAGISTPITRQAHREEHNGILEYSFTHELQISSSSVGGALLLRERTQCSNKGKTRNKGNKGNQGIKMKKRKKERTPGNVPAELCPNCVTFGG